MRCLLIGGMLCASVSAAAAGEPAPPAAAPERSIAHAPAGSADAAAHLRAAAEHLEAAGLPEPAAELRARAAQLRGRDYEAALARKLAECEALQAEIAALRKLTGRENQVLLRVTVLEVDRDKLAERGVEWAGPSGSTGSAAGIGHSAVMDADEAESLQGFIEWALKNNIARVLAEPSLVTLSERPAWFNIGGEFPVLSPQADGRIEIEYKRFGTQVDFLPIDLGGGKLRLQFRARVSELDHARSTTVGNVIVPGLRVREVETGAEMRRGQILVIGGLTEDRVILEEIAPDDHDDPFTSPVEPRRVERHSTVELLVVARPQVIDAAGPATGQAERVRPPLRAVDAPRYRSPR